MWGVGPGRHSVWHYDGKKWTTLHDDNLAMYDVNCTYGFSKNNVWAAGGNGRIYHYDGNNWSLNYQHTINGFIGIGLYDLYGVSPNNLYAVGAVWFDNETRRGIILHYDGSKWEQKYLAGYNSLFIEVKVTFDNKCYIHCVKQDVKNYGTDTTVIYKFDTSGLHELYNDKDKYPIGARISIIAGEAYFVLGTNIYRYQQNSFVEFLKTGSIWTPSFYGRNEKDIILGTSDGIEHYNGSDIQLLMAKRGFNNGILFDNEVVLLNAITENGSIIYHGKLK
jgi:hypothetical protein